jgi:hypothetical protein
MVQVEHRKRFAGEEHLVVVQPEMSARAKELVAT